MAAPAVAPVNQAPAAAPAAAPAPAPAPVQTFLSRCVEELTPITVSDFESTAKWKDIAALGTIIAFTALAIGAFILTGVFLSPLYLPIAGISALLLAPTAVSFYNKFDQEAQLAKMEAAKHTVIQRHYQDLTTMNTLQIQTILLQKGINWLQIPGMSAANPARITEVNPLIARHLYWEGQIQTLENQKQEHQTKLQTLRAGNPEENRENIFVAGQNILHSERLIADAKLKCGFINAVLRKPDFAGGMSQVGEISTLSTEERLVAGALGDAAANQLYVFNNRAIQPLTIDDVKRMSVAALGQRIVAAMA